MVNMDDNGNSSSTKDNIVGTAVKPTAVAPNTMTKENHSNHFVRSASRQVSHIPRLQRSASLRLKKSDVNSISSININNKDKNGNVNGLNGKSGLPLRRSHSFSCSMERATNLTTNNTKESNGLLHHHRRSSSEFEEDDASSMKSYASSNNSLASCDLGSTVSGRRSSASLGRKKYVLHCQRPVPQTDEKYLTPTQRKDRQIRQLKAALVRATRGCEEKSVEVERLKAEVERLRFSYSVVSGNGSQICESPLPVTEATGPNHQEAEPSKLSLDCIDETEGREDGSRTPDVKIRNTNILEDSGILNDLLDNDSRPMSGSSISEVMVSPTEERGVRESAISERSVSSQSSRCSERSHRTNKLEKRDMEKPRNSCRETQTDVPCSLDYEDDKEGCYKDQYNSSLSCSFNNQASGTSSLNEAPNTLWQSLENIRRNHAMECQDMKEKHNNKVEDLLQKLSELNSRYFEVRSAYEKSLERIRVLDTQVSELRKEMSCQEEWHSQMYLKMYRKGQEAAKFEHADEVLEFAHKAPKRVSVPELLQQLHRAEHDLEQMKELYRCELYRRKSGGSGIAPNSNPMTSQQAAENFASGAYHSSDRSAEYTLKFLKDAVYYYLTEKDNKGHLQAIESILGFSEAEKKNVAKAIRKNIRLV